MVETDVNAGLGLVHRLVDLAEKLRDAVRAELQEGVQLGDLGQQRSGRFDRVEEQVQVERLLGVVALIPIRQPAQALDDGVPIETAPFGLGATLVAETAAQRDPHQALDLV